MADEKKINHDFDWNRDPSFFLKQPKEDCEITLGPNLSWSLMTPPDSQEVLHRQQERFGISGPYERAA
jgi:hypothetical protein